MIDQHRQQLINELKKHRDRLSQIQESLRQVDDSDEARSSIQMARFSLISAIHSVRKIGVEEEPVEEMPVEEMPVEEMPVEVAEEPVEVEEKNKPVSESTEK